MEDFLFDSSSMEPENSYFVLVIYDIQSNKRRVKLSKLLLGYGFRIQKSAFEAIISKMKYNRLLQALERFADEKDSIRVYHVEGKSCVKCFGNDLAKEIDEIIVW